MEDGGRAAGQLGPYQQAVLPPAEVVRGGIVSPLQSRHSPLLLGPPQENILPAAA